MNQNCLPCAGWQSSKDWKNGDATYAGMVEVSRALMKVGTTPSALAPKSGTRAAMKGAYGQPRCEVERTRVQ